MSHKDPDPSCPFCTIATAHPYHPTSTTTLSSSSSSSSLYNPQKTDPSSYIILSTEHVVAFLDIQPITRGHVLVTTRRHRVRVSELREPEGGELGRWLPILSRVVMRTVLGTKFDNEGRVIEDGDGANGGGGGDWNLVQNNGPRAAQVVPHVHFHIIPRPGTIPDLKARSWTMFGRGQRNELDDDDAEVLAAELREGVRKELEKESPKAKEKL